MSGIKRIASRPVVLRSVDEHSLPARRQAPLCDGPVRSGFIARAPSPLSKLGSLCQRAQRLISERGTQAGKVAALTSAMLLTGCHGDTAPHQGAQLGAQLSAESRQPWTVQLSLAELGDRGDLPSLDQVAARFTALEEGTRAFVERNPSYGAQAKLLESCSASAKAAVLALSKSGADPRVILSSTLSLTAIDDWIKQANQELGRLTEIKALEPGTPLAPALRCEVDGGKVGVPDPAQLLAELERASRAFLAAKPESNAPCRPACRSGFEAELRQATATAQADGGQNLSEAGRLVANTVASIQLRLQQLVDLDHGFATRIAEDRAKLWPQRGWLELARLGSRVVFLGGGMDGQGADQNRAELRSATGHLAAAAGLLSAGTDYARLDRLIRSGESELKSVEEQVASSNASSTQDLAALLVSLAMYLGALAMLYLLVDIARDVRNRRLAQDQTGPNVDAMLKEPADSRRSW